MAVQTINDASLAELLFDVFRSRGYEGATLSLLSEVTGLKKSSLYHRFPKGKDDMVKAVVLYVSEQLHLHVIQPLLNNSETPENRFTNMLTTIKAFYNDGRKNCLLNILSLGETKPEINELLNKDYNAWLSALINLGQEVGLSQDEAKTRSEHFLIVVEGALVIQRLTSNPLTFQQSIELEKTVFFNISSN